MRSRSRILKVSGSEGVIFISEGLVSVSALVSDGQISVLISVSDLEVETLSLQVTNALHC